MEKSIEVKIPKVRPLIYVVGIAIAIFLAFIINASVVNPTVLGIWRYDLGQCTFGSAFISVGGMLIVILLIPILAIVGYVAPKLLLTPAELGFLLSTAFATAWVSGTLIAGNIFSEGIGFRIAEPYNTLMGPYMPDLLAPSDPEVINTYLYGGPVNWGAWAGPIIFWTAAILVYAFLGMFLALLFRKAWVEIEMLPFPGTTIISSALIAVVTLTSRRPRLFSKGFRIFWLGFIIGIVIYMHLVIQIFIPGFPGIGYPGGMIQEYNDFSIEAHRFIPGIALCLSFIPALFAFGYLIPLDTALSYVFFALFVNWVIPICAVAVGLPYDPTWDVWTIEWQYGQVLPPYYMQIGVYGAGIALGILPFLTHRRYIVSTLKRAFGMNIEIDETTEPLPYRVIWLGIIAFSVINMILFVGLGAPFTAIFPIWLLSILWWIGYARAYSECGLLSAAGMYDRWANVAGYYGMMGNFGGTPAIVTHVYGRHMIETWSGQWRNTTVNTIFTDILGKQFSTSARDVFIGNVIGYALAVIIGVPVAVWAVNNKGALNPPVGWTGAGRAGTAKETLFDGAGTIMGIRLDGPAWWPPIITGIILVFVIGFLKSRYVWWPFSPYVIPMSFEYNSCIYWFPTLVALTLKYITLKIGGARAYEGYGIPLVIGFCIGGYSMMGISALVQAIRFLMQI
jgi:hypothetical protein